MSMTSEHTYLYLEHDAGLRAETFKATNDELAFARARAIAQRPNGSLYHYDATKHRQDQLEFLGVVSER